MEEKKPSEALQEQTQIDRLELLKSRLAVAKAWCKKPHEAWKRWIAEYEIENFDDTSEIRDKVRIGYIFRKTENENSSIFDDQPELFIKGRVNDYKVIEDIYNSAYDLLWDKQNLEEKIEDVGVYFELLGMGMIDSPYEVKTKKVTEIVQSPVLDQFGQPIVDPMTGQPQTQPEEKVYEVPTYDMPNAKVKNPFRIFFSPETIFNHKLDTEHCPYYFEEDSWVKERIKARFNKDVAANEKMYTGEGDVDAEIDTSYEKGSAVISDDLKRATVYLYYGTLPEDLAKGIKDKDGNDVEWAWDKEYKIYFTKTTELEVTECEYEYKPLHIVGNYGLANKFWKFGDAKHLLPLVQELELYRSQILMHTRKMVNPKPLIESASEVDMEAFNDPRVGKPVKYTGTAPVYLSPSPLGREVEVGVEQARTDLEKTAPSFDLAGGGGQSEVRTPRGIATFSEAADKTSRRKRKKIARLIRQLIIFQFMQLGMYWSPDDGKTLEIGGKEEAVTPEVLQVLSDPNLLDKVAIEVESLSVNRVQMKQDALDLWDAAIAAPQIFNVPEVARDMLQNAFNKRDADRYLVSMNQMATGNIMQFVQQLGQANPQLAAQLMQYVQQPNMQQMQQQSQEPQANPQQPSQPAPQQAAPGGLPPLGNF